MLNHIDSSYKASKKWQLKTKLNHFETFDFASNFPSDLLALINHDLSANSGLTNEEPTDEDKIEKMIQYAKTTNDEKPANFMTRSYYAMHLNNWLDYFDEKSIFITTDLELQANSRKVFSRIEDFLGVDKHTAKLNTKFLPNEAYKSRTVKSPMWLPIFYKWFRLEAQQAKIKLPNYWVNITQAESPAEL